jgi:hypothetical protein
MPLFQTHPTRTSILQGANILLSSKYFIIEQIFYYRANILLSSKYFIIEQIFYYRANILLSSKYFIIEQ